MAGLNLRFKPEPQACPASYAGARVKVPFPKRKPYYGRKKHMSFLKPFNRDFHASRFNEKWVTDITYLIFNRQRLFLSTIKDLYNNEIISYQVSRRNDLKLVIVTIKKQRKNGMLKELFRIATRGTNTLPTNTITYLKNIKCNPVCQERETAGITLVWRISSATLNRSVSI